MKKLIYEISLHLKGMYENEKKWGKHIQDAEGLAEEMHEYPCLYKKKIMDTMRGTGRKTLCRTVEQC